MKKHSFFYVWADDNRKAKVFRKNRIILKRNSYFILKQLTETDRMNEIE